MSKKISRTKLREFAFLLRCEGMDACQEAHGIVDSNEPRKKAALKERGELKKSIAIRIEQMLEGGSA